MNALAPGPQFSTSLIGIFCSAFVICTRQMGRYKKSTWLILTRGCSVQKQYFNREFRPHEGEVAIISFPWLPSV